MHGFDLDQLSERYGKWNSVWRWFSRICRSGLWTELLRMIAAGYPDLAHRIMINASHVKAHQDSTRSTLSSEEQRLGKT